MASGAVCGARRKPGRWISAIPWGFERREPPPSREWAFSARRDFTDVIQGLGARNLVPANRELMSLKQKTPIALFIYNRPQHAELALESLSQCDRLDECSLQIYCDGPKQADDVNVAAARQ